MKFTPTYTFPATAVTFPLPRSFFSASPLHLALQRRYTVVGDVSTGGWRKKGKNTKLRAAGGGGGGQGFGPSNPNPSAYYPDDDEEGEDEVEKEAVEGTVVNDMSVLGSIRVNICV